jgi:hypothetical protein
VKKPYFIALALIIILGIIYFRNTKISSISTNQSEKIILLSEKKAAKPAMSIHETRSKTASPKTSEKNPKDEEHKSPDQNIFSPEYLQKMSREKFGDINNEDVPRYEDYGDDDKILYLYIMSLGTGPDFLQNLKSYTAPLKDVQKPNETKRFWSDLIGEWKGDFISEKVKDQDANAYFSLIITSSGFKISLRDANQIYLTTESHNYSDEIRTGSNNQLPKNLIVTMKAKPELGYKHDIYLQLFPSQSNQVIVGGMYNSDQWIDNEHYVLSDKILFQRVQP